jgi:hypothetical protein
MFFEREELLSVGPRLRTGNCQRLGKEEDPWRNRGRLDCRLSEPL